MRKVNGLVLTLLPFILTGCGFLNQPLEKNPSSNSEIGYENYDSNDSNKYQKAPESMTYKYLEIEGDVTKKHYSLMDSWSTDGLIFVGKGIDNIKYSLSKNDLNISFSPTNPKDFGGVLTVTAKLKNDLSKEASILIKGLSVDSEVYNFENEKSLYYADIDLTLRGKNLFNKLNYHSFNKHSYFVSYQEVNNYKSKMNTGHDSCDVIPNESMLELFYTGKKDTLSAGTREHVWAANDSANLWDHDDLTNSYRGGGSDLYHIRPVDSNLNTVRGDAPFVDFDDSEFSSYRKSVVSKGDGGPYKLKAYGLDNSGSFAKYVEVADEFKGDVARIIAYVYMHYSLTTLTPSSYRKYCSSYLSIGKAIGYSTESKCFKKLIEWNNLDPVSEVEKYRNHVVQKIQGNRNPFVDYPEMMSNIFSTL